MLLGSQGIYDTATIVQWVADTEMIVDAWSSTSHTGKNGAGG